MFDHIRPLLKDCGFTQRESDIYLTLLLLGTSSVQEIAEKSHVNRTATYPALESLIEKGLVIEGEQAGRAVFTARSPERLRENLAGDLETMRYRMQRLNDSMKELLAAFQDGQGKPHVQYFEGMSEILRLRDEIAMSQDALLEWFVIDEYFDRIIEAASDKRDRQMRLQHGRTVLVTPRGSALPSFDANRFDVRACYVDQAPFSGGLAITGQKSYLFTHGKEPAVLVIYSPALTQMMRTVFELVWSQSVMIPKR